MRLRRSGCRRRSGLDGAARRGVRPNLAEAVSGRYLSFRGRKDIAIWCVQNVGVREIARRLGGSPSTISRAVRPNASTNTYRLEYRASVAAVWKTAAS